MTIPIILWGASGHAKVLRELMERRGHKVVAVFDNDADLRSPFPDVPLFTGMEGFRRWRGEVGDTPVGGLVAIGGSRGRDRLQIQRRLAEFGVRAAVAVHPSAFVAGDAVLGDGSQVLAQAAVCVEVRVGEGCIINTGSSVDHEAELGDGVHLAPGAILAGCVSVGEYTLIGPGATVLPRVKIGRNVIIGAGSVVTRDIPDDVVAYGAPAKVQRTNLLQN